MSINHLILGCPLLLLPSIFPNIRVFSNQLALHIRWPKYQSFNISPSNEYPGFISFRIDSLTLGLISLLSRDSQDSSPVPQFQSIKSSVLSLLYGPTLTPTHDYWKNRTLTIWTFVGKVMPLLFNVLTRFVIALLPRSKHLLISWVLSITSL